MEFWCTLGGVRGGDDESLDAGEDMTVREKVGQGHHSAFYDRLLALRGRRNFRPRTAQDLRARRWLPPAKIHSAASGPVRLPLGHD